MTVVTVVVVAVVVVEVVVVVTVVVVAVAVVEETVMLVVVVVTVVIVDVVTVAPTAGMFALVPPTHRADLLPSNEDPAMVPVVPIEAGTASVSVGPSNPIAYE